MYGTLEPIGKVSMGNGLVQGTKRQKQVTYTEVIHNHYKFWHAVDDHNAKRHSPISLEVVWVTKWPNRVFAFILSVTEVNAMLAYKHFCKEEFDGMLGFRKLLAEALVCNPYYKEENPLDYISVYTRIIDIYKKSDDTTFHNKIEALRGFENILDFQKSVAQERIFFHTNQAELEFLIFNNNFEEGLRMMQIVAKSLKENKFNIEPYYFIGMYYQFACILLINKNLSQSLKYINLILNEFKLEDRPKTFIKTEIINLIIHYELKNYKLALHNHSTFNKKYKRVFKLNFIEKNIIQAIIQISENPFSTNETVEFKKLHTKIQKKNDLEDNISNKIYRKYIDSKLNRN